MQTEDCAYWPEDNDERIEGLNEYNDSFMVAFQGKHHLPLVEYFCVVCQSINLGCDLPNSIDAVFSDTYFMRNTKLCKCGSSAVFPKLDGIHLLEILTRLRNERLKKLK